MSEAASTSSNDRGNERYVRWQGLRIGQLGLSVALCLSFTVATLGFSIGLLIQHASDIADEFAKLSLILSVGCGLLAVLFGFLVYLTRLLDFRATAQVARHDADPKMAAAVNRWRKEYEDWGKWTWRLFWSQIIAFALQVLLLMLAVWITYVPRLFGYPNENLNVGLAGIVSPQAPE